MATITSSPEPQHIGMKQAKAIGAQQNTKGQEKDNTRNFEQLRQDLGANASQNGHDHLERNLKRCIHRLWDEEWRRDRYPGED